MFVLPRREQGLDGAAHRAEFPALARPLNGRPLVYLDSAASTQRPRAVLDAMQACYAEGHADASGRAHALGARAGEAYAHARTVASRFLRAGSPAEVVFTESGSRAIERVAELWGTAHIGDGDELVVTELEHSANLAPWMRLAERVGARVHVAPVDVRGELDVQALAALCGPRTRLVAVTHLSHVTGGLTPVARIAALVHAHGALLLVDGAQAAARLELDVAELGADFYCLSGHKVYGPSGIGVLWARPGLLQGLAPVRGAGAVRSLRLPMPGRSAIAWAEGPERFEAGAPNVPAAVGLAAALTWLDDLDRREVCEHQRRLTAYATERLLEVPGLSLVGAPQTRLGAVTFVLGTVQAQDVATLLDARGVAVSAGHHDAHLFAARTGLRATVRASFGVYSTHRDVDALVLALRQAREAYA